MSIIWEPCAAGARVLRVLGDSPCPAVPETVEGLPVTEIGPYCFADKPVKAGARRSGADTHEITGNFVEEVTLPDTVRTLHSAAFYNCRRLRRLSLGAGVEGLGSDLFTNCRSLARLCLRAAPDAPTGLKKLLGAISADITAEFDGARLFYPEYSEFLDENTPAHIFNHNIEGEGALCRLALGRLVLPCALGGQARADYEFYLRAHPAAAFRLAIDTRDEAVLRLLVGLGLPTAEAAAYCARAGWSAGAAILLGRAKRAKKSYSFDDL